MFFGLAANRVGAGCAHTHKPPSPAISLLPRRSKLSVLIFLVPPLAFYGLAVLFPILQSLFRRLFSWDGITALQFVGVHNYDGMLTRDDVFWHACGNALGYLAVCLLFQLGVSLFVANLLTYLPRGREVFKTLYLLPAIISTVAIAFLFQHIYSFEPPGLINQVLNFVGLRALPTPWLSNVRTVLIAVSAPQAFPSCRLIFLF